MNRLRHKWNHFKEVLKMIGSILINKNRIILVGSPLHGNVGDHAIAIATLNFLHTYFPEKKVIEIPGMKFANYKKYIQRLFSKEDVILISGGGFLGDLWVNEEEMVRDVISTFPQNKVVILPQTIFFENIDGKEYQRTKKIYEAHRNLHICLRDKQSYDFVKKRLDGMEYVYYIPDLVLFLEENLESGYENNTLLFCFREDKEKVVKDLEIEECANFLEQAGYEVKYTTTVIDRDISFSDRGIVFSSKLAEFQESRLVLTDRLHGMIFAVITGTPCIALNNVSGKVKGVYKWIENLEYVKVVDSLSGVYGCLEKMQVEKQFYSNEVLKEYYKELAGIICSRD
ncbi:MAG: polysaccharide pyruvyl transferase family protein [Lachnospiraceae bacterium]